MFQYIWVLITLPLMVINTSMARCQSFSVMSFNVRFDNPDDGRHAWPKRKAYVVDIIESYQADIIGVQEAEYHQLTYMAEQLEDHTWFGKGRKDGEKKGEFTAIFFNATRFELLRNRTLWCSKTPDIPSKDWDAALPRTITWGLFRDRDTHKEILIYNTHFDHVGETARQECARILLQEIAKIRKNNNSLPVLITGDFNATPDSKPYNILTGRGENKATVKLSDTINLSLTPHHGPKGTFTGFNTDKVSESPIDYIFVNGNITVHSHTTIDDIYNGILPSDHYPVFVTISLPD